MARGELSRTIRAAADGFLVAPRPQCTRAMRLVHRSFRPATRSISTTSSQNADFSFEAPEQALPYFTAAPEIDFQQNEGPGGKSKGDQSLLRTLRVVPASPSYFSAKPNFHDDYLHLCALLRSVATLPTVPTAEAPRVAWKGIDHYRIMTNEPVKTQKFHKMVHILRRLNCVHPDLLPEHVKTSMRRFMKPTQADNVAPPPAELDKFGRARGVGRRKTSTAVVWLIEGEGEVIVNGRSLSTFFGRLHHRESAVWALKATHRLDKYNIFALVEGGGSTGQAEAMTLAVAKALMVHEPALKPALRRGKFTLMLTIT